MIENHRDEELCRRWDAFADEDHTHHLTNYTIILFQSKWWLHSNKQGSNTVPLRHRVNNGHRVLLLHGGIGKVHGGLLILPKVTMEMNQVLSERGDPLLAVFGKLLRN